MVLGRLKEMDDASQIRYALVHLGRLDRPDDRPGWRDAGDVRRWLVGQYPQLRYQRPAARLEEVVKRDGRRQPFERSKLERSIGHASKGRGSKGDVWELATEVASDVEKELGDQPIVTSGQIAAEILRSLRGGDHIAYLRYASTAKAFASPDDYEAEALALRHVMTRDRGQPGAHDHS